ncbi:MAG: TolC family protein [Myxococcota bacterium]
MFFLLAAVASGAELSPDDAVRAALRVHPDLARAEGDLLAARGLARQSATLRFNPSVDAGYALVGDRVEASIAQPISLTGEGLAAGRSARAGVDAAEAARARTRLEVAAEVRTAWADAVLARERAQLAAEAHALAVRLREAAAARMEAGEAAALDVQLAHLEEAKAARDLLEARATEGAAVAALSVLVGTPAGDLQLSDDPLAAAPAPRAAAEERSDVRAARAGVASARAALARERAAVLPAVEVGAFYERDDAATEVGPTVGVEIPLWTRNPAGIGAAHGELVAAEARLTAADRRAAAEADTTRAVAEEAARITGQLGEDLPGDTRSALQSIEAGFRAGELDLLQTVLLRAEVIDGQGAWLDARAETARAHIRHLLAVEDAALVPSEAP